MQRVSQASVAVDDQTIGTIETGLLILLGVAVGDSLDDVIALARKVAELRIFPNEQGKMDLSLKDIAGGALVVSQFTLYGDCSKGRRPNFTQAARPEEAQALYERFCAELKVQGVHRVETGQFGAEMSVSLCNEGPVTLIIESPPNRTS